MCFTYPVCPYIQSGQFMRNTYTEIPVKNQRVNLIQCVVHFGYVIMCISSQCLMYAQKFWTYQIIKWQQQFDYITDTKYLSSETLNDS
jgi:hypothetical protein